MKPAMAPRRCALCKAPRVFVEVVDRKTVGRAFLNLCLDCATNRWHEALRIKSSPAEELKQLRDHAVATKEFIVEHLETLWKNNEQIASLSDGVQKVQAGARAKAFKQIMFAVMKIDFLPEEKTDE